MLKQFEQEQWELFDAPAKEIATKFWIQLGYECIENPDDYGIDLLVKGKGKEFGCEVEVKLGWHGPIFTFPTLHICVRKKKFMNSRHIHGNEQQPHSWRCSEQKAYLGLTSD